MNQSPRSVETIKILPALYRFDEKNLAHKIWPSSEGYSVDSQRFNTSWQLVGGRHGHKIYDITTIITIADCIIIYMLTEERICSKLLAPQSSGVTKWHPYVVGCAAIQKLLIWKRFIILFTSCKGYSNPSVFMIPVRPITCAMQMKVFCAFYLIEALLRHLVLLLASFSL